MAIKKIIIEPNKLLRQISQPVNEVNKEIQSIMDDMLETMYSANGIGLAAIQIGIPKNLRNFTPIPKRSRWLARIVHDPLRRPQRPQRFNVH